MGSGVLFVPRVPNEYGENEALLKEFCGELPQVSAETNSRLKQLGELHVAQQSMQDWTVLQSLLGHCGSMLDICNESVVSGSLPLSCRRAVITLLPKKGHLHEIKKFRHSVSGLQDSVQGFGQQAERSYEAIFLLEMSQ